jgi:hypothetical protein
MDDEHLHQEGYFEAFAAVINALDPKAADLDFQFANLSNAARISTLLSDDEKRRLRAMLHIVRTQAGPNGGTG